VEAVTALVLGRGEQLPGELDGAFLEVVAEGEVAAHLEERAVPGGLADLFDVRRAHALLDAGGAGEGRLDLAEEVGLEGHHAGRDEQQSRVVRDERRRRDDGVPALLEEAQPAAADLGRLHQWSSFRLYGYVLYVWWAGRIAEPSTYGAVLRFSMAVWRRGGRRGLRWRRAGPVRPPAGPWCRGPRRRSRRAGPGAGRPPRSPCSSR